MYCFGLYCFTCATLETNYNTYIYTYNKNGFQLTVTESNRLTFHVYCAVLGLLGEEGFEVMVFGFLGFLRLPTYDLHIM